MKSDSSGCFRHLRRSELERVFGISEQIHRIDSTESFTENLHEIFRQAFGHAHFFIELHQMDPFRTLERINLSRALDQIDNGLEFFNAHVHEHPQFHMLANPKTDVGTTQLQPCYPDYLKTALYNDFMSKIDSQHHMWIAISEDNQFLNCIYARDRAYSDNELATMHLLCPHVETAWRHWKNIRQLKSEFQALEQTGNQNLRKMFDTLPRRQWEIAERVALGLDNQKIADELGISIRTVQKHLQLIFQTLEVRKRTELVKKWQEANPEAVS